MMTYDEIQVKVQPHSKPISELTILKITALVLLIFVHSDLLFAYPNIMKPAEWFLLSTFFFVGGYLAYSSFMKKGKSLKQFFKSKALTLYVPFVAAVVFYLLLDSAMGAQTTPMALFSQVSMLNVFAGLNSVYNWGTLWFIPFMLLFMVITCVLERYVKNTKTQLLTITSVLIGTTILWTYEAPLRLDGLFNQYMLVFVFGFYISKFKVYEKLMNYKMALVATPIVAMFAIDFSGLFNYNTLLNALVANVYFNCRSIALTMGLVLLALLALRKIKIPVNGFAKQISDHSAFIYLSEPFISFVILTYIFGQGEAVFASGPMFYLYQAVRIGVLLGGIPLILMALKYRPKILFYHFIGQMVVFYKNTLVRR